MKNSVMQYPVRYGYSLAGTVIDIGYDGKSDEINNENSKENNNKNNVENVDKKRNEWIGKRVFVFSSHQSHVVANISDVMIIPDDVSFVDAVFLPSVETAVSLVMIANPILGFKI
jgi:hypothetical protein